MTSYRRLLSLCTSLALLLVLAAWVTAYDAPQVSSGGSSVDLSAVDEDVLPDADSTRDLGSATKRWTEVHADTLEGGGQSYSLTSDGFGPAPGSEGADIGQPTTWWGQMRLSGKIRGVNTGDNTETGTLDLAAAGSLDATTSVTLKAGGTDRVAVSATGTAVTGTLTLGSDVTITRDAAGDARAGTSAGANAIWEAKTLRLGPDNTSTDDVTLTHGSGGAALVLAGDFVPSTSNTRIFGAGGNQWKHMFCNSEFLASGGVVAGSDDQYAFATTTDANTSNSPATVDTGLSRASAGVVKVTDGSSGTGVLQAPEVRSATTTTLTDAATILFTVALPSGTRAGGVADVMLEATDGTDHQVRVETIRWACVNKAGAYTTSVQTISNGEDATAMSVGTLTATYDATTGTDVVNFRVTPTGSLTETTYQARVVVHNLSAQTVTVN